MNPAEVTDIYPWQEEGEAFWSTAFLRRPYRARLEAEAIAPLRLLDGLDDKIFATGKSIEMLHRLGKVVRSEEEVGLFEGFLASIASQLQGERRGEEVVGEEEGGRPLDGELAAIVGSSDCPYLALALQEVLEEATREPATSTSSLLLPHVRPDPLLPLAAVLRRAVAPVVERRHAAASSTLVTLFLQDLRLEATLSRARKLFFMEAGDLMHSFCSQLFPLLEEEGEEAADSSSLTLLLQDCLAPRFPGWAELCSVERAGPGLQGVTLHLAADWPLTLVLTRANLATYNAVFQFLASVKRSLWALQAIRPARLRELEEEQELSTSSLALPSPDTSLPLAGKQHRLQLLRSWLLYFTSTVHGYFMSRVVHSTELQLAARLRAARDLDTILAVHQEYLDRIHDRCFLHPSAGMLREAVVMVLGLGVELHQASTSPLPLHTRTLLGWEERYVRCHTFLASTLQAMTSRRKLPHLEGLTVALLHSCPS